jgi:hypothetical protein
VGALTDGSGSIGAKTVNSRRYAVRQSPKAVPVAISFLASLLGLGGISDVIRKNIERIQAPVNKAIDWLIGKAVKLAKSIAGLFGSKKKEDKTPETADPEHDAKVEAGLAALDQMEVTKLEGGKISRANAEVVATSVMKAHPVFVSIRVVDGDGQWNFEYVASSPVEHPGKPKAEGEGTVDEQALVDEIIQGLTVRGGETRLTEISVRHARENIQGILSTEGVPASSLTDINDLLDEALQARSGDEISRVMAKVSGAVNEHLKSAGSSVRVAAHHVDRVAEQVITFVNTKWGRLYIRKRYCDAIAKWVSDNAHLGADVVEKHRKEIVAELRNQLIDDMLTSLDEPLEEVDMVVATSGKHRALHAAERL